MRECKKTKTGGEDVSCSKTRSDPEEGSGPGAAAAAERRRKLAGEVLHELEELDCHDAVRRSASKMLAGKIIEEEGRMDGDGEERRGKNEHTNLSGKRGDVLHVMFVPGSLQENNVFY